MRTNIVLDDKLVRAAMKFSGARTKRDVVNLALQRLVEGQKVKHARILELAGDGCLDPGYDVRAVRQRMGRGTR